MEKQELRYIYISELPGVICLDNICNIYIDEDDDLMICYFGKKVDIALSFGDENLSKKYLKKIKKFLNIIKLEENTTL